MILWLVYYCCLCCLLHMNHVHTVTVQLSLYNKRKHKVLVEQHGQKLSESILYLLVWCVFQHLSSPWDRNFIQTCIVSFNPSLHLTLQMYKIMVQEMAAFDRFVCVQGFKFLSLTVCQKLKQKRTTI